MFKKRYTSKRERFLEVGEARTNAVLDRIRVLGNCANRSLYEYQEEEISTMFRAIQNFLEDTKTKFLIQNKAKKEIFKFKKNI